MAEYAVAPIKSTAKRPANVSAVDAAALGVAGQSALQSLRDYGDIKLDGSSNNKNVLVTAASGGVGTYAVQVHHHLLLSSKSIFIHSYLRGLQGLRL